ncbi:MAG: haloacid dehalogenase type II [Gammaproteobacteria bacterium]|jgi:2-haloacid dehalogenase
MVNASTIIVAFDVYGTLIDTHGIVSTLEKYVGTRAFTFSQTWRDKQLEYSFRRGLMQAYKEFSVCTKDALEYTCKLYSAELTRQQKEHLLDTYKTLPAFNDAKAGLDKAKEAGYKLYAFSNGKAQAVELLLTRAGLRGYFQDVVSVDEVRSFKPDPAVYKHFLERAGSLAANTWLVSSNSFDVIGAMAAGMKTAWVQRVPQSIFDPWGIEPTVTVESLSELTDAILFQQSWE